MVLSRASHKITDFDLARTGTKLAVLLTDHSHEIFDVSAPDNPILDCSYEQRCATRPTHHVPGQAYELKEGDAFNDDGARATGIDKLTQQVTAPPDLQKSFDRACTAGKSLLKLYQLTAEPHLYAPILEFAPGETVFPTETNIWETLGAGRPPDLRWQSPSKRVARPDGRKIQQAWLDRYTALPNDEKRKQGAVYYCVQSFPGSWLFEFWTYYPFDVGHVEDHPHDTEHVFVEVDKLGGRIVGVLAAAHSSLTPNNLYSALQPDAEPARLPLAVIVEKGKHALAPDINRDRRFTPGLDVNILSQNSQLWGVRDAIGQSDAHMLAYESSMTLHRDWSEAWAVDEFGSYFDIAPFEGLRPVYKLVLFPHRPVLTNATGLFSRPYAEYLLNAHTDFRKVTSIYKPDVFPFRMVRVGVGNTGQGPIIPGRDSVFSVEYVNDLAHLPLLGRVAKAPLPGRLAFQFMVGTTYAQAPVLTYPPGCSPYDCPPVPTGVTLLQSGHRFYYGVQYENSITNLFGYYVGFLNERDRLGKPYCLAQYQSVCAANYYYDFAQPVPPARELVGQLGVYFVIPRFRNMTLQVGPVFSWPYQTPGLPVAVGLFYRLNVCVWQWRGRSKFGNPFTR